MLKARPRVNIFWKSFALAVFYAVFWAAIHFLFTDAKASATWLVPQLLSSILIFFTFNGLFATFDYYRYGFWPQLFVASLYVHPFFQLFYFQTYKSFMEQQNISLLLREPYFLIKVLVSEMTLDKAVILLAAIVAFWWFNRKVMGRPELARRSLKPYDVFLNRWALAFTFFMVFMQVKWCLHHDTSQLVMRPLYPVTLMAMISVLVHLIRVEAAFWQRAFVAALIFANAGQLYALNLGFLDERGRFTLDQQYYRALFGAFFVQAAFGDMQQDDHARKEFANLPVAKNDYNILISINDAQRWDHLSSNGYPRKTDEELDWFYKKSFNFRFPISPANFTDTAIPSLLYGMASDQDVRKIKGSLAVWDYFAKSSNTFFVSSQDITWSKLDLFYSSIGQEHIWSATAQPSYKGNPEDTNDQLSYDYLKTYLPNLQSPWVGVWQTFASHYPYTINPEFARYKPCDHDRSTGVDAFRNCYLNAQVFSTHLRSELFKKLDMDNTVVVLTSDHGEGIGEHGIFFHGVDYHQEMVRVPFNLHIPQRILDRLPKDAVQNMKDNLGKVISTTDMVPTLLHMHQMLTGQELHKDLSQFTGRSLFTHWDHRVVFSSHCFPQYRCYSREILFADDNYFVLFRPLEGFYRIYDTWKDPEQKHPLDFSKIDRVKFEILVEEAARIHSAGKSMKAYYEGFKANGFKHF